MKKNAFFKWVNIIGIALFAACALFFNYWVNSISSNTILKNPNMSIWVVIGISFFGFVPLIVFLIFLKKRNADDQQTLLNLNFNDWKDFDPRHFPVEKDAELTLPFDQAFHLSQLAIQLLPSFEIVDANPGTGTIKAGSESGVSMVMITLEKIGEKVTRIHIGSYYPRPVYVNGGGSFDSGTNKKNVTTICNYLQEQARQRALSDPMRIPSYQDYSNSPGGDLPASFKVSLETNPFYRDPQKAAILSLIIPGLGQSYNGRTDEGVEIALVTGMGLMLYLVPGILFWAYGIYDAFSAARKINSQDIPYRNTSLPGMILTGCFSILCLAGAYYVIMFFGIPGLVTLGLDMLSR
jgi:hypothetical protein